MYATHRIGNLTVIGLSMLFVLTGIVMDVQVVINTIHAFVDLYMILLLYIIPVVVIQCMVLLIGEVMCRRTPLDF
jgi:hypothetical protein